MSDCPPGCRVNFNIFAYGVMATMWRNSQYIYSFIASCIIHYYIPLFFSFQDEKVLIVIGGDDNYSDDDEENRSMLSRRARNTALSRQLRPQFIDGRKSFIFSWNRKHRAIHEEALIHYFDSTKKGQKFTSQLVAEPVRIEPRPEETWITSPVATQSQVIMTCPIIDLRIPRSNAVQWAKGLCSGDFTDHRMVDLKIFHRFRANRKSFL